MDIQQRIAKIKEIQGSGISSIPPVIPTDILPEIEKVKESLLSSIKGKKLTETKVTKK